MAHADRKWKSDKLQPDRRKKGWQLYSISRWTAEDGMKLRKHLEEGFEKNRNHQIYWDDVAMFCHFDEYELGIISMEKNDIVEVDSFDDLVELDNSYKNVYGRKRR